MRKLRGDVSFDRYVLWILVSVELLLSFTSLGYIHIPPISLTIVYLPIFVGGCLFGPRESVALGFVFGFTSMLKATASYVLPSDAVFSPAVSGAPVRSLLLSTGARMLFGLVIGLAFQSVRKRKHHILWFGVISAFGPKVHSLIVYTALGLLFPELGYRAASAFHWELDDALIALACVLIVELTWLIYHSAAVQDIRSSINQSVHDPYTPQRLSMFFSAFEFFVLCTAVFVVGYFSQRETYMLEQQGIPVTREISADLLNLQVQFLLATLALNAISLILLAATYRYMAYKKYRGEIDELTGVMGRRMFLYHCEKAQKSGNAAPEQSGWFLFVDADYFKQINDTLGHPAGDHVLRAIASHLQTVFGDAGAVGRLGGDEFAAIVERTMSLEELQQRLERFLRAVAGTLPDREVSCSIGAYQFRFPREVQELLEETDEVLYRAKERGRACYEVKALPDG